MGKNIKRLLLSRSLPLLRSGSTRVGKAIKVFHGKEKFEKGGSRMVDKKKIYRYFQRTNIHEQSFLLHITEANRVLISIFVHTQALLHRSSQFYILAVILTWLLSLIRIRAR